MQPLAATPPAMAPTEGLPVPHGASGRQDRPPHLPSPGAHLSVPASGLQRQEPLQLLLGPGGCQLRSTSPLKSPAPAEGQAAGSEVRRLGLDPCNTAQTGLCGSSAGPPGPHRSTSTDCPGPASNVRMITGPSGARGLCVRHLRHLGHAPHYLILNVVEHFHTLNIPHEFCFIFQQI
ncbi:hypothetical protein NDU88_002236 [Pleurodeles waltl]|uniref:Uncharacterized protein n=1 Tax=Pleurodeles waltl TaxID=8319 RepID=A0AAV7M1T6_PLEWA|nr:hypothetical protein NDU88_002236 [Pleurodeles waltl]